MTDEDLEAWAEKLAADSVALGEKPDEPMQRIDQHILSDLAAFTKHLDRALFWADRNKPNPYIDEVLAILNTIKTRGKD